MATNQKDTDRLLLSASTGDPVALDALFNRYCKALRKMIQVRLDTRLRSRVDPSDIVQETLAVAAQRLPEYAKNPPLPFYPWLRQIATDRLVEVHRRHLKARKRNVRREEPLTLPDSSSIELARRIACREPGPEEQAISQDDLRAVLRAIEKLGARDREILVLRYLEGSDTAEAALALNISQSAAKLRLLRALQRLRAILGPGVLDD